VHWRLSSVNASRLVEDVRAGRPRQDHRELSGFGSDLRPSVDLVCSEFRETFAGLRSVTVSGSGRGAAGIRVDDLGRDAIEGHLSCQVYEGLKDLDPRVLTDPGFWRYLAVWEMFEYVQWRDGRDCDLASFGAGANALTWDCVSRRMFVRGLIAYEARGDESWHSLARIAGTDVWRSHVLRVRTGESPILSSALLELWEKREIRTREVRDVAKRIKRLRSNVAFEIMDRSQIDSLLERQIEAIRRESWE